MKFTAAGVALASFDETGLATAAAGSLFPQRFNLKEADRAARRLRETVIDRDGDVLRLQEEAIPQAAALSRGNGCVATEEIRRDESRLDEGDFDFVLGNFLAKRLRKTPNR